MKIGIDVGGTKTEGILLNPNGTEIDRKSKGMGIRSSRYVMIIQNFEVQNIQEEKETKSCGISSAEGILNLI